MLISCSICKEEVTPDCDASFLICGHVFHTTCITIWFEQKRTCPFCRSTSTHTPLKLIFYKEKVETPERDNVCDSLIEELSSELEMKTRKVEELRAEISDIQRQVDAKKEQLAEVRKRTRRYEFDVSVYELQYRIAQERFDRYKQLEERCRRNEQKIEYLTRIQNLIQNPVGAEITDKEVTETLVHDLCAVVECLKFQLDYNIKKRDREVKRLEADIEECNEKLRLQENAVDEETKAKEAREARRQKLKKDRRNMFSPKIRARRLANEMKEIDEKIEAIKRKHGEDAFDWVPDLEELR